MIKMNEIKAGDWIEIRKVSQKDSKLGLCIRDFAVVTGVDDRGVYVRFDDGRRHYLYAEQFKKVESRVEPPKLKDVPKAKIERVASSHYQNANNNDVWQFADDNLSEERVKGFHQVNAIKYITRYHIKHDTMEKRIEDLEKAKVYIDKLIELERQA